MTDNSKHAHLLALATTDGGVCQMEAPSAAAAAAWLRALHAAAAAAEVRPAAPPPISFRLTG